MICTRCKNTLDDIWIKVRLDTVVERCKADDTVETVENSKVISTETLCPDCFEKFCDVIENGMQNV